MPATSSLFALLGNLPDTSRGCLLGYAPRLVRLRDRSTAPIVRTSPRLVTGYSSPPHGLVSPMTSTTELSGWPHEPAPLCVPTPTPLPLTHRLSFSVGYLSRKALPIKRNDAEPLTREDVQFDLLEHIFSDTNSVFTSQVPGTFSKVNFRDLYVNALYHSSKCSKVLKDKMVETPAFAVELAKISLLTNVGRINTTMACMHWCYGSCMVI